MWDTLLFKIQLAHFGLKQIDFGLKKSKTLKWTHTGRFKDPDPHKNETDL